MSLNTAGDSTTLGQGKLKDSKVSFGNGLNDTNSLRILAGDAASTTSVLTSTMPKGMLSGETNLTPNVTKSALRSPRIDVTSPKVTPIDGGTTSRAVPVTHPLVNQFDAEYIAALRRNYAALSRVCKEQAEAADSLQVQLDEARAMLQQVDLKEEKMQSLQDQLDAANQRVKRSDAEAAKLDSQLESQSQRIRMLQSQVATLTRTSSDAVSKLATVQGQLDVQMSEQKNLQRLLADKSQDKHVEILQSEVHQLHLRIHDLEKSLADEKVVSAQREKEVLRAKNVEHRGAIDRRALMDDVERATQRNKTLQQTIERLNTELQRASDQIEAKSLDIQLLRRDLAKAHEDKAKTVKAALVEASLRIEQVTKGTPSDVLKSDSETPNEDLTRLRAEYSLLREQFESLWEEKSSVDEQMKVLSENSSKFQQDVDAALKRELLHKEITSQLSTQVVELTKQVSDLVAQRDGFVERIGDSHTLVEQTVSELRQAHSAQDALVDENNELKKQVQELQKKLSSETSTLRSERTAKDGAVIAEKEFKHELNSLRETLNEFKTNTSTLESENSILRSRAETLAREVEALKQDAKITASYEEMKRTSFEQAVRVEAQEEARTKLRQSIVDELRHEILLELEPKLKEKLRSELETEVRGQVASHLQTLESKSSALTSEIVKLKHENVQLHAVIDAAGIA